VCLAHLSNFNNLIRSSRGKATCDRVKTDDVLNSKLFDLKFKCGYISFKRVLILLQFNDNRGEVCTDDALETCFLVDSRHDDILSLWS
jgi:hypothetical protein